MNKSAFSQNVIKRMKPIIIFIVRFHCALSLYVVRTVAFVCSYPPTARKQALAFFATETIVKYSAKEMGEVNRVIFNTQSGGCVRMCLNYKNFEQRIQMGVVFGERINAKQNRHYDGTV